MRLWVFIAVVAVAVTAMSAAGGTNTVAKGDCEDGRQWFLSIEVNDNGEPTCYQGLTCDGLMYSTCQSELDASDAELPRSNSEAHGERIEVTMNDFEGRVTVHDVYTGELIQDFGVVSANSSLSQQLRPGRYLVVTRDALTGKVTDSDLISVE
ncbi:MAG: hypothetical protein J5I53_06115 [Bradyrhizobiaceae bacterium]|nr:hypothetical protein [Bradyrhizobiaceae bacterium]